ncbi:MAG: hypothetical protein AAGF45_05665 [Pseudomonadota bacterium]
MKRSFTILMAAVFAAAALPALADDDDFIGLYRGVFEQAGSLDTLSIVPNEGGGYRIALYATRYERCRGADRSAVATADGEVRNGVLHRSNASGVCNGDGSNVNWGDGEMTLSHDEELLTWKSPRGRLTYYHRVSD